MRRRILILEGLPVVSGGQQVLLDVLPGIAEYDLHALLPASGPLANALSAAGVMCHFAPMASYTLVSKDWRDVARFPADQLRLAASCARLARRLDVDLLYANCSRTFVWGSLGAALAHRPLVWHVHNQLADRKTAVLVGWVGSWRRVCRIIAVSRTAAAQFPRLAHKIAVVPATVDPNGFRSDRSARRRVRTELGILPDARVVGIVGDLIPLKGQLTFVEAAARGPSDLHYLVVGDARPDDRESASYAAMLHDVAGPNVVFSGRRDDLGDVLNALDVLVIASDRETGPLVLLEALACGIPVLSTPVGRAPEILPTEALFPIADAGALRDRLASLFSDAHAYARAKLTASDLAEQHVGLDRFRADMRSQIESCLVRGRP
jgi:glycosyltransferase involved in cell wall biosynthesis